jgi:cobalt/nickel transport system permease protein
MHISDGLLPGTVCVAGYVVAGISTAASLRRTADRDVPRLALMTSAFFAASLIHVRVGPASVHLLLHGLVGAVVGPGAMIPIVVGLSMQALLFGHGGVTTIGVNALVLGLPALAAGWVVRRWGGGRRGAASWHASRPAVLGFVVGSGAVLSSTVLFLVVGLSADRAFYTAITAFVVAHLPLAALEGLVTAGAVRFLAKVKPEVFDASGQTVLGRATDAV